MKDAVKLGAVVLVAAALAWGFVNLESRKGYALQKGSVAPAIRLPSLSGESVDLQALRGRVVLVNFWATWCPPCVEEMPSLEKLHRTLGPEGLSVVGVSVDEDEAALRAFVQKIGVTFPTLRDPGGRGPAAAYKTTGYPETYVLDPQGVLIESYIGPSDWASPGAIEHFRELMRRYAPAPPAAAAR